MVKRRAIAAELSARTCNHSFRASGITAYLENGGTIEKAQQIAAHESPKTTKLYDRTDDRLTLDEIKRIMFYINIESSVCHVEHMGHIKFWSMCSL